MARIGTPPGRRTGPSSPPTMSDGCHGEREELTASTDYAASTQTGLDQASSPLLSKTRT